MAFRRRFLLASSLARLIQRERGSLRQIEGFFPPQRDRSSSVRLEENAAFLVLRSFDTDHGAEDQTEIPIPHAHALLDVCAGNVDYSRTVLPLGGNTALIDQVVRPQPLHLVTVEFETEDQARRFRPQQWFGPEVTSDPRFANQSIALKGVDGIPDVPLSDPVLNSLIDALDGRFPDRDQITPTRPIARQVRSTRAKAQANADVVKVDLADLEQAMMRDMEIALQKSRPE